MKDIETEKHESSKDDTKEGIAVDYLKLSLEDKYKYCVETYNNIMNHFEEKFKKNLVMKYILKDLEHTFRYDHEIKKFLFNDIIFENINNLIMYLRVYYFEEISINWIHPFYSNDIQYYDEDSKLWYPLSTL